MKGHKEFQLHMPIEKEMDKLPKGWIANVAYTLVGDDFATWIMNQVDARNLKIAQDRNLMINLDPEIAAAFAASTSVARKLFL